MEFKYPNTIYFDITDEDSDIYLQPTTAKLQQAYMMTGRGSSGVVYVNSSLTLCIKLILYPLLDDESVEILTQRYENEVILQMQSFAAGFAPIVHRNFKTTIEINGVVFQAYVIVMDYLNPAEWHNIPRNQVTRGMVFEFVTTTKLYNDVDPYNHFYQKINGRNRGKIVMIDYGNVKNCKEQIDTCIEKMLSKFQNSYGRSREREHSHSPPQHRPKYRKVLNQGDRRWGGRKQRTIKMKHIRRRRQISKRTTKRNRY